MKKNMTIQTLIYSGKIGFLNRIEMRDCEKDRYEGCTNYYKEKIGSLHTFSYTYVIIVLIYFKGINTGILEIL